ncbi:hypothetical protein SU69_03980 [Thermosipho melanesiensis]|uniref:Uncharacterized protein n=2 Tax=Thermosipho melanesiensis TaxID=46541 RepID=A6LL37_THEM4|nr:hypothetical protein [Thermosipho melanesiensis]ABR30638.1 hypothetical protein Tmel_0776 [Thermosipho melanesiensis BI429]APT74851.1 hypothetical protein BW47_04190 [Thermosipho melanesiensis]OOC35716.1 hypothetical protein SU68_04035 [Thermosipho melanesiensis]OOC39015.1 hypothetical protein SU69_03980 [Thermosipho melanesiensis]OOC39163.1 hypothetical protein SU70_03980 [Thermosipho melanesiensis]
MTDEKYEKILNALKHTTCYKPGEILEEKVIKIIQKRKKISNLGKVLILVLSIGVVSSLFLLNFDKPKTELFADNQTHINSTIEDFESIYNITLVSDGF